MWSRAAVVICVVAVACGGPSEPSDVASRERPPAEGASTTTAPDNEGRAKRTAIERGDDAAPDFEVATFAGEDFRLSEHVGTPVVLTFWESW